jgi:hypothetical protein
VILTTLIAIVAMFTGLFVGWEVGTAVTNDELE